MVFKIFKASSELFPSLIAKGFSRQFYCRAREVFAPGNGKTSGAFSL